jgi:hypothetical protein
MCLGTHGAEQNVANQEAAYTNTMISEGAQIFGQDSSVFNQLVGAYSPIVKAGPSQPGFSAAESNALNAAAIQNTAAGYRNAAAATKSGVAGFGGGNTLSTSGVGLNANVAVGEAAANQQATELNKIQQANWSQGHQNWLQASQGLQATPGTFNNMEGFNKSAQAGLNANMANAQAQDAASNWWVKPVMGLAGDAASMVTGGLANLDTTGSSTGGEQASNFFQGALGSR